jgi:hypothetical protein
VLNAFLHRLLKMIPEEEKEMTQEKDKKGDFTGCCPGEGFRFPMGDTEKLSEMMKDCCSEEGSFNCSAMMDMFKDEDGSFDVSKMMEVMKEMMSNE